MLTVLLSQLIIRPMSVCYKLKINHHCYNITANKMCVTSFNVVNTKLQNELALKQTV